MEGMPSDSVTVRVPASTSNCGPGFDTLGIALGLWNTVNVRRAERRKGAPELAVRNLAGGGRDAGGEDLAEAAARAFFAAAKVDPFPVDFTVNGEVPPARGLGSSVTVLAGILAGLNRLCGTGWTRERFVAVLTELEGHPDNASAAVLGGFCASRQCPQTRKWLGTQRFPIPPEVRFLVAVPRLEVLTSDSRRALPRSLPFADAVRSMNGAVWVTACVARGDWAGLRHATEDFLHQPYRLPSIPGAREAIDAGMRAGAWGGWLSGSGSSVLCVASAEAAAEVARAMARPFAEQGGCRALDLASEPAGMQVVEGGAS